MKSTVILALVATALSIFGLGVLAAPKLSPQPPVGTEPPEPQTSIDQAVGPAPPHAFPQTSFGGEQANALAHAVPVSSDGPSPLPTEGNHQSYAARDGLSANLVAEPRDPTWAPSTEATLRSRLRAALPGATEVRSVECKSSLCRVTLVQHSEEEIAGLQAVMMDPSRRPWPGEVFILRADESTGAQTWPQDLLMFVAREGESLSAD